MKNRKEAIKLVICICVIYVICFGTTYQLSWLLHYGKNDLVKVEATKLGISPDHNGKRSACYMTKVEYEYDGERYEEEMLSDARDWKRDRITLYIEVDHPKQVYRDTYLLIPISNASIYALASSLLAIFLCVRLYIIKKEEVVDYKIPNP
ncbi:MAG: hypothetical protein J6B19_04305 [Lachnospiraceae bacterium]|nr:hypothetical protein [Lachnospiraceae bacterium]